MEIEVEKIINKDHEKSYKVKRVTGVIEQKYLPKEYLKDSPNFFKDNTWAKWWLDCKNRDTIRDVSFSIGTIFSEQAFLDVMSDIVESGRRLNIINDKRRMLEQTWNGVVFFII